MNVKLCIDCNEKASVERRRCAECVKVHNRIRVMKYHRKDKPRYGIIDCSVCGHKLIKGRPNQSTHGKCRIIRKTVDNYSSVPRTKKGITIARQIVLDLGFTLNRKLHVHHVDEDPYNNVLSNFWVLSNKNHASLHRFLEKEWSLLKKLNSSNLENCWNSLRGQLTTTWLEITGVNVIKITDISRSAAEPLNEDYVYMFSNEEGSETMYQVSVTGNAVDKDIVQTQIT